MTRHDGPPGRIRDILRWWPLVMVVTLIAVGAAIWSETRAAPSYTATTRLVLVPLAQWDETFIGTSLVRDSGDPKRTATTMAALLNSRRAARVAADYLDSGWTAEAVDKAITVSVNQDTNVIDIVAHSPSRDLAQKLAEGFAYATLADRWRTISAELDARITAIAATTAADPNSGEASDRLQTLTVIREEGSDPTLRIDSTTPATRDGRMPIEMVVGLGAAGGLFVGLLAAAGMARLRREMNVPTPEPRLRAGPTPAHSSNEES